MKTSTTGIQPVRKHIHVDLPPAEAFRLFTEEIGAWWPLATHSVAGEEATGCAIEPGVGGQIYETDSREGRHVWGTLLVWEPPHRLVFTWHPGREASGAQEVEVQCLAVGSGTRIELEHRGWEILGEDAQRLRDGYDEGWGRVLGERFLEYCRSRRPI